VYGVVEYTRDGRTPEIFIRESSPSTLLRRSLGDPLFGDLGTVHGELGPSWYLLILTITWSETAATQSSRDSHPSIRSVINEFCERESCNLEVGQSRLVHTRLEYFKLLRLGGVTKPHDDKCVFPSRRF